MSKSARELELIIMRLKSQIEAKNEQIEKTNQYIQEATDQTQKIIVRFRAFCAKILENELAYSRITTRELETMPLEELLARAEVMHRQGQIKSREIYETMKRKLMDKNTVITGLTDQVTQLKVMLDNAADIFSGNENEPDPDTDRTAAYLLDTDASVDDVRPAISEAEDLEEGEKVFDVAKSLTIETKNISQSKTVPKAEASYQVVDIGALKSAMTPVMWLYVQVVGDTGFTEYAEIRGEIIKRSQKKPSDSTVYNAHNSLLSSGLITAQKILCGNRWFLGVELTQTGTQIYAEQFGKAPVESEMRRLIREHDNVNHGYAIKDVARILEDSGKYKSVSARRRANTIALGENRRCIPDIVCCGDGVIDYFEVDCGNHLQSDFNDKCNKLKSITKNLHFIAPTRDDMMDKLKPQIEKWISACGGPYALAQSGITVYLTSIHDFSAGKWAYIYNMEGEEPGCLIRFRRKSGTPAGKE